MIFNVLKWSKHILFYIIFFSAWRLNASRIKRKTHKTWFKITFCSNTEGSEWLANGFPVWRHALKLENQAFFGFIDLIQAGWYISMPQVQTCNNRIGQGVIFLNQKQTVVEKSGAGRPVYLFFI